MRTWKWIVLLLSAPLLSSAPGAQCTIVGGTGCPGLPPIKTCTNNPSIGTLFCMNSAPCPTACSTFQVNLWFFSSPFPTSIGLPTCCIPAPQICVLYAPLFNQTKLRLPGPECYLIPNNPALIGVSLGIQPVCVGLPALCYDIYPALMVTLRP
jgi:hypothetical protein